MEKTGEQKHLHGQCEFRIKCYGLYYILFRQETPVDVDLKIGNDKFVLNKQSGDLSKNIAVKQEKITSVLYYKDASGNPAVMQYDSPYDKSDKIRTGKYII